jgi:hypothetical protein
LEKRELVASSWLPILLLGALTLILEPASTILERAPSLIQTLSVLITLFLLGLYGLGDALILAGICLTHVSTTRPLLQGCLLRLLYPDFSLTVLLNSEILSLMMILSNFVHNLRAGAWGNLKEESFKKRVMKMLLLRAVRQGVEDLGKVYDGQKTFFVKKTVPMVVFILPGYVATLFLGSLIPLQPVCSSPRV